MSNALISFPDRTLSATLSGGSWNASYPLSNLKDKSMTKTARSSNLLTTSTQISIDLGVVPTADGLSVAAPVVRCLGCLNHNFTFNATVRLRGYTDSSHANYVTGTDTGTQRVWPASLSLDDYNNSPSNWVYSLPTDVNPRYWLLEIVDLLNPDGYIDFGRLWIGGAFEAGIGISYGASLGFTPNDVIQKSLDNTVWGEHKESDRNVVATFETLTSSEKRKMLMMQKTQSLLGEVLWVMNSQASAEDMLLESFPALAKQASPLSYPYFDANSMPLELTEIRGSGRVRTVTTSLTFSVPLSSDLITLLGSAATFTRASSCWYPDANEAMTQYGNNVPVFDLLTGKGYLSEPASTNKCTCYGVPRADSLGSEVISNAADRDFTSDTGYWVKGAGVTIPADGTATFTAANSTGCYKFNISVGKVYSVTWTILTCTAGGFQIGNGASQPNNSITRNTPGTYTNVVGPLTTGACGIWAIGVTSGTIGDISIKEVVDGAGTKAYYYGGAFQQTITNMTLGGDTGGVLSIVTDQAAIDAAGLTALVNGGKVYKVVGGAGGGFVTFTGNGSTGAMAGIYYRSDYTYAAAFGYSTSAIEIPTSPSYTRLKTTTGFPSAGACGFAFPAGGIAYFIVPQVEDLTAVTSIMPTVGASATRAATVLSFPVSGNIPAAPWTIILEATFLCPSSQMGSAALLGSANGTSWVSLIPDATSLTFRKRVAGVNYDAVIPLSVAAGDTRRIALRYNADKTTDIFKTGVKGTGNVDTSTMVLGSSFFIGSDGAGAYQTPCTIKAVRIFNTALTDAQLIEMTT